MSREEAIRILKNFSLCGVYHQLIRMNDTDSKAISMAIKALEQPEIIRCKECKHRNTDECPMYYEEWIEYDEGDGFIERDFIPHDRTVSDGFCFKGERREDE